MREERWVGGEWEDVRPGLGCVCVGWVGGWWIVRRGAIVFSAVERRGGCVVGECRVRA